MKQAPCRQGANRSKVTQGWNKIGNRIMDWYQEQWILGPINLSLCILIHSNAIWRTKFESISYFFSSKAQNPSCKINIIHHLRKRKFQSTKSTSCYLILLLSKMEANQNCHILNCSCWTVTNNWIQEEIWLQKKNNLWRQRKLEEAPLFSGQFEVALKLSWTGLIRWRKHSTTRTRSWRSRHCHWAG